MLVSRLYLLLFKKLKLIFKKRKFVILLYIFLFFVLLSFSSLLPLTYDDSYFMVASKNLALLGKYAYIQFPFDPTVTTGFPVIVPVALMFKLFYVDVVTARIVSVLYTLLFLTSIYLLPQKLNILNKRYSFLCLILSLILILFSVPNALYLFLTEYGDIPSITFYLLSLIAFTSFINDHKMKYIFLIGILLGLSFSTKYQDFIAVISTLFAFGYYLLSKTKKERIKRFLIIVIGVLLPETLFQTYRLIESGFHAFINMTIYTFLSYKHMDTLTFLENPTSNNFFNHLLVLKNLDLLSFLPFLLFIFIIPSIYYFFKKREFILLSFSIYVFLTYFWWFFVSHNTYIKHLNLGTIILDILLSIIILSFLQTTVSTIKNHTYKLSGIFLLGAICLVTIPNLSLHIFKDTNFCFRCYSTKNNEETITSNFIKDKKDSLFYVVSGLKSAPELSFMSGQTFRLMLNKNALDNSKESYLILNNLLLMTEPGQYVWYKKMFCPNQKIVLQTVNYLICGLKEKPGIRKIGTPGGRYT